MRMVIHEEEKDKEEVRFILKYDEAMPGGIVLVAVREDGREIGGGRILTITEDGKLIRWGYINRDIPLKKTADGRILESGVDESPVTESEFPMMLIRDNVQKKTRMCITEPDGTPIPDGNICALTDSGILELFTCVNEDLGLKLREDNKRIKFRTID